MSRAATVAFNACYRSANGLEVHHELSTFVNINGLWYFLDPTVEINLSMKQACLCGSGKKFKQCCGPFLRNSTQ
ncbi:YchJ family metal-binding protein [Chelonobacter oris]|uniref:YchJ family metal-binding protein n=1 Tax=Chelonobacter oris TaxID=505317 RepID=UPI00244AC1F0|nr:YchJ family metal-binding protein [Chelonobacter oris]